MGGASHVFDSFECAVYLLASRCAHCECRVIGHGVEGNGDTFCCVQRASRAGVKAMKDRA